MSESFFNFSDGNYIDAVYVSTLKGAEILVWNYYIAEAEFLRFRHPLLDSADRAYFATETNLSGHTPPLFYSSVHIA